jgi:hypothetical protein
MALEWTKKGNGHVGQFSFRIPSAPLYTSPPPIVPPKFGVPVIVRVQTQNRVLFEGGTSQSLVDYLLIYVRSLPHLQFFPGMQLGYYQYVSIGAGPRIDWSGYLAQPQIDLIISCLNGGACPGLPRQPFIRAVNDRRISARTRGGFATVFGLPNTLGQTGASVSVGGGLLGLAVLALAGYGVYKLVT